MTFPTIIEKTDLPDLASTLAWLTPELPAFRDSLNKSGAILFRGLPISSAEDFDRLSAAFQFDDFTYQESLSNAVRINHTPRVFTANEAPPEVEIFLHHEMAQTPLSPEKIFFCCLSAAEAGGATPLCRSDQLYSAFKQQYPDWASQFESLGLKYTIQMPSENDVNSGQGRSWRSTLSVDNQSQAEQKLADLGYSWQWHNDGSLSATTPTLPAVKLLPDGSSSFYNQVIAAFFGWKNLEKSLTFGNGEKIPPAALEALSTLAQGFTFDLEWQDGDVALVDNHRVMHGRRSYSGARKRLVLVSLAKEPKA